MTEPSSPTSPAETPATATAAPTPTETTSTTPPTTTPSTPPTETKPEPSALNAKSEEPKAEDKPKAPEGAPEKYEFVAPEGYELDKKLTDEAAKVFKELNIPQAAAQRLVDFYSKNAIDSSQAALQSFKDMRAGWVSEAKKLPEIGPELGQGGKVVTAVGRMLDQIGDAKLANDFRQAMDLTGAGDHPAFIQVMYRLAQKLGEGSPITGRGPSPHGQVAPGQQRRTAAQEIYPNLGT